MSHCDSLSVLGSALCLHLGSRAVTGWLHFRNLTSRSLPFSSFHSSPPFLLIFFFFPRFIPFFCGNSPISLFHTPCFPSPVIPNHPTNYPSLWSINPPSTYPHPFSPFAASPFCTHPFSFSLLYPPLGPSPFAFSIPILKFRRHCPSSLTPPFPLSSSPASHSVPSRCPPSSNSTAG